MIGARLAEAGTATSALARGATLEALRDNGWQLHEQGRLRGGPVVVSDDPAELGQPPVIVLAVKAQALAALAARIEPMVGPDTVLVPAMNGVPWWFCEGLGGPVDGMRLGSVDPDGAIAAALPASQVVGCVVHLSASTSAPGVSVHGTKQELILGEPDGADSTRLHEVGDLLTAAGFDITRSARVQTDVWFKLWGNMTMNPISVLTGTTMDQIVGDDLVVGFIREIMIEAREIGERIGTPVEQDVDERLEITRSMGPMRTSMLQDADAGRSIELDALVGAVHELGRAVDVPTPFTDALLGLTRVAARARGLYPA
ncbi:2-dehydropantoate 2-reductase [Angustibacter sp. McL0619]|uniref:2-dehydropantoate 2-reductase n=1 Tax=Angustibacter sp. McL0619 TaxID=3415676 RepID=UPI003CEE18AE